MDDLLEIVKLVAGSDAGAVAIIALLAYFVLWAYGKFVKMQTKHEAFEKTCDGLVSRTEKIESAIHEIRGDIAYIKNMVNVQVNTPTEGQGTMLAAHSPLSLTDIGREAAADMGAEAAIARRWDAIRARLDAEVTGRTPYDIQTYCLEKIPLAPQEFFDSEAVDAFKSYAFNHGRTLFECMKVVGILVRDKYFSALGISTAALDCDTAK